MVTAVVLLLALSATPVVQLQPQVTALGVATPLTLQVSDRHGVRKAVVSVEQNGIRYSAWETQAAGATHLLAARRSRQCLELGGRNQDHAATQRR